MTIGDRMWVAFWALLVLANIHDISWMVMAVIVLVIGVVSDFYATAQQRLTQE